MIYLKDNAQRAQTTQIFFVILPILSFIGLLVGLFQYHALTSYRNGSGTYSDIELSDLLTILISIPQSVIQIITGIVFLYWFRRAYWNLHQLPNTHCESGDSMAVWGFIIPFISLFKPPQIMKEIWLKSQQYIIIRRADYPIRRTNYLIGLWWAIFIIINFVGRFAIRSAFKENDSIDGLIGSTVMYMIADFLDIPGSIITWFLINDVKKVEADLHKVVQEENYTEASAMVA